MAYFVVRYFKAYWSNKLVMGMGDCANVDKRKYYDSDSYICACYHGCGPAPCGHAHSQALTSLAKYREIATRGVAK